MIALIYTRVSTEDQARRGFSLPEQLEACRRRAAELGATEMIDVVDDVGGDWLERPKLEQARQLVRAGGIRWFLCLDPDRFSRNLLNQLLVTDEIDKAGVDLVFIQHDRQKTAEGNLFYAIRGAISEFEKKKIIERTQRGKRGKAKQGMLPGHLDAYGYTMDTESDRLVVNEAEAEWVRRIFDWAANLDPGQRMGQYRIADRLNQLGVPAPRCNHWYRSTVAGILRNPLYTGVLRWGRYDHSGVYQAKRAGGARVRARPRPEEQIITLPVPPIISPAVFGQVQAYIELDRCRRSRGRTFMLTGIGRCGLCGGHVQTKSMRRRYLVCAGRYPLYREMSAERRAAVRPCSLPHVQAELVEAFVWRTVCDWLTNPSALRTAFPADSQPAAPEQLLRDELALIVRQIDELEKAQARVIALVARAAVKPEIVDAQLSAIGAKIRSLTERQTEVEQRLVRVAESGAPVSAAGAPAAAEVQRRLDRLSDEHRLHLVRRLVAQVIIDGRKEADWRVVPIRFACASRCRDEPV